MMRIREVVIILCLVHHAISQFDCPLEWIQYEQTCYKFNFYPTYTYIHAAGACRVDGATLLSVNTEGEHQFIANWLSSNVIDKNLNWYTSGMDIGGHYKWEGDGTDLPEIVHWKTDAEIQKKATQSQIIYTFDPLPSIYTWGWSAQLHSLPYICEISQDESYKINEALRDFTYGSKIEDVSKIEKGPRMIEEPQSIMIIKDTAIIHLECVANALPLPTYRWYKSYGTKKQTEVSDKTDTRYTTTNGRFTISNPKTIKDTGDYQCIVSNKFGSILSNPITVVGGYINDFSNEAPGVVTGQLYQGTFMECNTPVFNPAVDYQWYKNDIRQFVRPRLNKHTFISRNGKLYFSELQANDAGLYYCVVTLTTVGNILMPTHQAPTKVSLGIGLHVASETANKYGPLIHNDFPDVFPKPPLRAQDVRLECFAYGRLPMHYKWEREEYGLPANISFDDGQRIMTIHNARLEDSGRYTCHVQRGDSSASKTIFVSIEARPYFMFPLKDQHLDKGTRVSWTCQSISIPRATYTWYKNSEVLTSVPGDYEVKGNVLTIESADKQHEGMYQCRAENYHGVTYTSAQLRILSIKPTFAKHPLRSTVATINGNMTIICSPEGAPFPAITWKKDGSELGLSVGVEGKRTLLPNGNLVIKQLTNSDGGQYTCTATNDLGTASSTATIYVTAETKLVNRPSPTKVLLNSTAFIYCEASYDAHKHDMAYTWLFYERLIDFEREPHYALGTRDGIHGLYIRSAQYIHHGEYKCIAQTPQDSDSASAFLTVYGPPGEPSGLFAKHVVGRNLDLRWTPGLIHGDPISAYEIEMENIFDLEWKVHKTNIDIAEVTLADDTTKHGYYIKDLTPGTQYRFKVIAKNIYGFGTPSIESEYYSIHDAPPVTALSKVWGGGGSVGELRIQWEPISPAFHAGPGFHYKVYWRRKENNFGSWLTSDSVPGDKDRFITIIEYHNYYREYDVKVQVFNALGAGPNSSVETIFSAEDMPLGTPQNVEASEINATAADVTWIPVQDDREHVRGRVWGYQINYWMEGLSYADAQSVSHYMQTDVGRIIGLNENSDYWVNVQVFNTAGMGPISEEYRVSTWAFAPFLYPEYVNVTSRDHESINVWWRGISTTMDEEALLGYKLRYWEAGDNMEVAREVVVGKVTHAVIDKLERGRVYKLRMLGYNYGGDGKKSPTVYFTLGGQISIDIVTTEILALGSTIQSSLSVLFLCSCLLCIL